MTQVAGLVIKIDSREAERKAQAVSEALAELTVKGESASRATKEFGRDLDNQKGSLVSYGASIKALVGYMAGIITVNEAISRADGFTQNAARIRNATQSAEEYKLVQDRLSKADFNKMMAFWRVYQCQPASFYADLVIDQGTRQQYLCNFMPGTFKTNEVNGNLYRINAQLEVVQNQKDLAADQALINDWVV